MRIALVIAAVLMIAGCDSSGQRAGRAQNEPRATASEKQALAELQPETWNTDFTRHSVPFGQFASGGPGADGIPPIDEPQLAAQRQADRFLTPREPVIAVVVRNEARAYPLQILVWHEIVNDHLAGRPIAVTYCPLCNSSLVFDRRVSGLVLTFGTTGLLRNSDLVMWDRQTQSWWQQFTGEALVGRFTGTRLRRLEAQTLSWEDFKARYPDGDVLSRKTGFERPYGDNPYLGYDSRDEPMFLPDRTDKRLPAVERVAAIRIGRDTAVVPFTRLARDPVIQARVGGRPAVVLYKRGVVSVLDQGYIPDSRDVGTVGVFDRRVRGRPLAFAAAGRSAYTDRQTGSRWDITGRAVSGALRGTQLRPLRHDEQFWFALAAFLPDARILRG